METYLRAAVERAMKIQEVILRAVAKKITWAQAGETIGLCERQMRRWKQRYEEFGYDGLFDHRLGKPSPKRVPLAIVEEVLRLYQEQYGDFNVRHFHEKLRERHHIRLSYTWVKHALQTAGLVKKSRKRGVHRRRRPRRPLPGMLLHLDGSSHAWFQDHRRYDLLVILDDATSEIYYAQLVEEESIATVMTALREVIEGKGAFCALYSDRASHFFYTPKAGQPVDRQRPTQVGRALAELGIQMIPAYSPQARGRGERNFGTWQRTLAAGTAPPGDPKRGGSQRVFAGELHRRVQSTLCDRRDATGTCLPTRARKESGSDLFPTTRAHREPGQHRAPRPLHSADRKDALARHAGWLSCHRLRASGWNLDHRLRPAHRGPLQPGRHTAATRAAPTSVEAGVATLLPPPRTRHNQQTPYT